MQNSSWSLYHTYIKVCWPKKLHPTNAHSPHYIFQAKLQDLDVHQSPEIITQKDYKGSSWCRNHMWNMGRALPLQLVGELGDSLLNMQWADWGHLWCLEKPFHSDTIQIWKRGFLPGHNVSFLGWHLSSLRNSPLVAVKHYPLCCPHVLCIVFAPHPFSSLSAPLPWSPCSVEVRISLRSSEWFTGDM